MTPYYQDDACTIYHGDCREILPKLPKVDLVLTDPPYDIVAKGGGIGSKRSYLKEIEGWTDCGFDVGLLGSFERWMCFCSQKQLPDIIKAAPKRWGLITWNKPNPTPLVNGNYLPDTEYIVHAFPNSSALHGDYKDRSRFILFPAQQVHQHPNEKPLLVICRLVRVASKEGETILDPFMGSGTTLRAAKDLGRKAVGIEIEERYCEIAAKRLAQEVLPL